MRNLFRRISRLEHGGDPPPPDRTEPVLLRIRGGPPDMPYRAEVGLRCLVPFPSEAEADFLDRALETAAESGEPYVIVSGLPSEV
jgi:hypothetical protein